MYLGARLELDRFVGATVVPQVGSLVTEDRGRQSAGWKDDLED
jgi:hypothetical protein